jgi:hypothetical protein
MRSKRRTEYRVLPIALAALVIALPGCARQPAPAGEEPLPPWFEGLSPAVDLRGFTEYPCDSQEAVAAAIAISARTGDVIQVTDSAYLGRSDEELEGFLVSAPYVAANELHDCQRLVVPGEQTPLELGPLTALYVNRDSLEGLNTGSGAGVVAEIINYDTVSYSTLGIQPGLNCLWVEPGASDDGTGWRAAVRQAPDGATCATADFDGAPSTALDVHRLQHGGSVYPSTGRWMWDGADSIQSQYIGIRCGDGWCELGPSGFTPTGSIADSSEVPGWFDEQYISYGPGNSLQVSEIWARLEPTDSIWLTDDPATFDTPRGIHVMTIVFQGGNSTGPGRTAYHNKLGLPPGLDRHEIRMRTRMVSGTYEWEAKSPGSGWTRISRLPYTHGVTGSVRWLWLYDDEGGWLPCDRGCCPVDQLRRVGT